LYGKSAAQVALRWLVQQKNVAIVPRALEYSEIEENMNIFDFHLTNSEMDNISKLREKNYRVVNPEVRRPVWD
jgi:2,5-diketo-D-gluconate reductase B